MQQENSRLAKHPEIQTRTTMFLRLISNLNYITKDLEFFIVSVLSPTSFDHREFTNESLNLPKVTHFYCKLQDSIKSPVIDRIRFSSNIQSLKLLGCCVAHPQIPDSLTELTIAVGENTLLLAGYSNLLSLEYPHLKLISLKVGSPFHNIGYSELSGNKPDDIFEKYPFISPFVTLMYLMSRREGFLDIIKRAIRKKKTLMKYF